MPGQVALTAFAQVPWLARLPADAVAALAAIADRFAIAAGDRLFAQHDPADGLYVITTGTIAVHGRTPGDGRVELAQLGPGSVLGELCLIDGGRRSADAVAVVPSCGWRLGLARFAALQAAGHPAAIALSAALCRQVAARSTALVSGLAGTGGPDADKPAPLADLPLTGADLAGKLASFPGFDGFSAGDWAQLAAAGRSHRLARGELLAPVHGPSRLWIVLRGATAWTTASADGGALQLLVHGPGTMAGAAAFVGGAAWPARLAVREEAELFSLGTMPPDTGSLGRQLAAMLGLALVRDQRRLTRVRGRLESLAAMATA